MTIDSRFKEIILSEIKNVDINEFENFSKKNSKYIQFAYANEIISDDDIKNSLEFSILKKIQNDYITLIKKKDLDINTLKEPQCFAYALVIKTFSDYELLQTPFYKENIIDDFVHNYFQCNITSRFKERLLNPKTININVDEHYS